MMVKSQRANQQYLQLILARRYGLMKHDNPHLLILSTSWQKEGGLLSFKCKWEYGLNPQRDGLRNGSWTLQGFDVSSFSNRALRAKLAQCSHKLKHLKHKLCMFGSKSVLSISEPREEAGKKRPKSRSRVILQIELWVILFLDEEVCNVVVAYTTQSN